MGCVSVCKRRWQGRANGVLWAKRFRRAGLARTWKERVDAGYASGLPLDLLSKQFVLPRSTAISIEGDVTAEVRSSLLPVSARVEGMVRDG
jgi:hypothetical protein